MKKKIRDLAIYSFVLSLLILLFGIVHVDDKILNLADVIHPHVTQSQPMVTPIEHHRPADQTFLTFPEWFLVFSPAEYATFTKTNAPSEFPFFGHIAQFWQSYRSCLGAVTGKYPFNTGYNVMIMVIGTSTTIEYALRGAYEAFVGRFTDLACAGCRTQEDDYGAAVAQDYVDFIRVQPWYEFDFTSKLSGLWTQTDFFGPNFFRKLERKYILSSDYLVKAGYGKLIKVATKASYDEPIPTTAVLVNNDAQIKLLSRYQAFTPEIIKLVESGLQFVEIAGNRGDILMSLITPNSWRPASPDYKVLFTQPILTDPEHARVALTTSVENLGTVLKSFSKPPFIIEHIFDY